MIKDAERDSGPVQAVENDPRVTRIGKILRATAMDELPQLWNIKSLRAISIRVRVSFPVPIF